MFRMFDAGGDKPLPFLDMQAEENPALGWRGGRLLLGHSFLLGAQARALARASLRGPVDVLYPMVVDLDQFVRLRKMFVSETEGLKTGVLRHGVMFEVPSSCLDARALFREADFGSIGTNDLVQYLFAVDRNNDKVAYDYSPDRSILWSVMRGVAREAERSGKELSVCGEIAGDPMYVNKLRKIGIRSVSVNPRLIPGVRLAVMDYMASAKRKERKQKR
jgi:phosphoenolpyruvate-protein kinase (PTS system EI component)